MAASGTYQRVNATAALSIQRSCVAQAFTRCAAATYGVALLIGTVFLLAGALAAAVTPEPLWVRALTFAVLGILPAITAYLLGSLTYWVMMAFGEVSDPVMRVT